VGKDSKMNAYELADLIGMCGDGGYNQDAAAMLRQQADRIKLLQDDGILLIHHIAYLGEEKKKLHLQKSYIVDLENTLEKSIKLNKAQAERQKK
jgi:hypothetical protein